MYNQSIKYKLAGWLAEHMFYHVLLGVSKLVMVLWPEPLQPRCGTLILSHLIGTNSAPVFFTSHVVPFFKGQECLDSSLGTGVCGGCGPCRC